MRNFTIAGSLPFVSSFTANHFSFIFLQNSNRSGCKVGSPPDITTASINHILVSKNEKKVSSDIFSILFISLGSTNSGL